MDSYKQQLQQLQLIPQQLQQEIASLQAGEVEKQREIVGLQEELQGKDAKIEKLELTVKRQADHFETLKANTFQEYRRLEQQRHLWVLQQ